MFFPEDYPAAPLQLRRWLAEHVMAQVEDPANLVIDLSQVSLADRASTNSPPDTRTEPVATQTILFEPFAGASSEPRQDLKVSKRIAGSCMGPSDLTTRSDAFRCISGNDIYDPCFHDPLGGATFLLCVQDPWSLQAIKLTPDHMPVSDSTPTDPQAGQLIAGGRLRRRRRGTGAGLAGGHDGPCSLREVAVDGARSRPCMTPC
jgi:hypothetical protein